MYIFVRFSAVVTIIFGVLLMLTGIFISIYGFFQNEAVTLWINSALETANDARRVVNAGYAGGILGAILFVLGMFTAAFGQLQLVFVDIATQTRETNLILRNLRSRNTEKPAVSTEADEQVYG